MSGVILVRADPPVIWLRRAGKLWVVIDGVRVGQVKQGSFARFPVEPGRHDIRVSGGGNRSKTVAVDVQDGKTCRVVAGGGEMSLLVSVVPILGILGVIPGLVFRVRVEEDEEPVARAADAASVPGAGSSNGLWWESDPKLAKRFQKHAES
jgi:hypothetical protein